jgi:hypothetical protein
MLVKDGRAGEGKASAWTRRYRQEILCLTGLLELFSLLFIRDLPVLHKSQENPM